MLTMVYVGVVQNWEIQVYTNDPLNVFQRNGNLYLKPVSLLCYQAPDKLELCKLSLCMRKPTICICENKDADQLRGNREADQRLCFRYTDSTISLLLISEISSF